MTHFYFFRNDGECSYMKKELSTYIPRYLKGPVLHNEEERTFYTVLSWIRRKNKGANLEHIKKLGINYIDTLEDLPDGAGVYITGYDLDLDDFETIKNNNIAYIERPCPWIKQLRNQLLNVNSKTHQVIFMIIKGHMVYDCYKSRFPEDIIIIQPENYKKTIRSQKNNKPVHLLVYAAFRRKDVLKVIDYINNEYPHPENITDGYKRSLCVWTKQGLFEEIDEAVASYGLNEIWIICSSEHDTSAMSIIRQVRDNGTRYRIIKDKNDIPESVDESDSIGVLYSAIPLPARMKHLKEITGNRFKNNTFINIKESPQ